MQALVVIGVRMQNPLDKLTNYSDHNHTHMYYTRVCVCVCVCVIPPTCVVYVYQL